MNQSVLLELLVASVRIATPLLLVALGGILSEKAGTFAVGLEGMMLMGAFSGAVTTYVTHQTAIGLLASAAGGAALAAVVAIATVRFRADQMVTGLGVNILAFGLTSFLLRGLFGGRAPVMVLPTLGPVPVPFLTDLPIVGPAFFQQPLLTYTAFLLTVPLYLFLMHTQAGLTLRAVGENPLAAFSGGADPIRVRMLAIIAGGAIAGLGGAVLSLQEIGTFTDGMTSGRGFIALAAIIVGRWMPFGVALACLLFGAASALALNIQGWGLPISSYVIQMTPYLIALAVLAGVGRTARLPESIGRPFERN
ncbi:MAG: ABC transporter permease [Verrucomicrobia bacterium]|nr:ABC transporter permease [Verrucomicrobiota bacterium]